MDKIQQMEKLKAKISQIATEIFALDLSCRTPNSEDAEFKTLRTKLTDAVWRWANLKFGTAKVKTAGIEIMQCVNRCVSNANSKSGEFVDYLSVALKLEIKRANERNAVQESRNITLPENKRRKLKQMIRYEVSCGKDISDARTQEKLATVIGCSAQKIAELVRYNEITKTIPEQAKNAEGEEVSLLETVAVFIRSGYSTAEDESVLTAELEHQLNAIDETFVSSQERTKAYLSALLTHRLLTELENARVSKQTIENLLCRKQFANTVEACKIIQSFFGNGDFITQEDVAAWFSRDKTDASRTLRKFWEKIENMRKKVSTLKKFEASI